MGWFLRLFSRQIAYPKAPFWWWFPKLGGYLSSTERSTHIGNHSTHVLPDCKFQLHWSGLHNTSENSETRTSHPWVLWIVPGRNNMNSVLKKKDCWNFLSEEIQQVDGWVLFFAGCAMVVQDIFHQRPNGRSGMMLKLRKNNNIMKK